MILTDSDVAIVPTVERTLCDKVSYHYYAT